MEEVVIVSGVRTPFGKFGGILRDLPLVELGGIVIREALRRINLDPAGVEEVCMGVNFPGSDREIARQCALKGGIPDEIPAFTVDRACCSSLTAIGVEFSNIRNGGVSVAVSGGTENLSQVPYFFHAARWGRRLGDIHLTDQLIISCPYSGVPRAVQAGLEALEYGIGREEQDRWGLRSHQLYQEAQKRGYFDKERMILEIPQGDNEILRMVEDESPRPDTTLEKLSKLPTIYGSPTVTAGNSPGLNTGSSALVLMSKRKATEKGLKPLAEILAHTRAAGHPQRIASIPAVAAKKVLKIGKIQLEEVDVFEINEAFAAMPLVSTKNLGDGDNEKVLAIRKKTNVNGGAIAIGHPTGATGGRLTMTLAYELRRRGGGIGLVSICGGIGQGEALLIKV